MCHFANQALEGELVVAGVFVRLYNEQRDFPIPDPPCLLQEPGGLHQHGIQRPSLRSMRHLQAADPAPEAQYLLKQVAHPLLTNQVPPQEPPPPPPPLLQISAKHIAFSSDMHCPKKKAMSFAQRNATARCATGKQFFASWRMSEENCNKMIERISGTSNRD